MSEHLPLNGKRILVTRPSQQAEKLCRMIENKGGIGIRFPTIDIYPPEKESVATERINKIGDYQIAIFTSRNAVDQTLRLLGKNYPTLTKLKLVAIGEGTSQQLQQAGFKNVIHARGLTNSEVLLQIPALQTAHVSNQHIVILRGETGRELLANELFKRGAKVDHICVYQQLCPTYEKAFLHKIWTQNIPHLIVVTSTQGLHNLLSILKPTYHSTLLGISLLVFSQRVADMAAELGFTQLPIIAKATSDRGILATAIEQLGH